MTLRVRLALTTLAVTVPLIAGLVWLDARARHAAAAERLSEVALDHLSRAGERERCEQSAATWGGVPLGPPEPDRGPRRPDPGRPDPGRPDLGHRDRGSEPRRRPGPPPGGAPPVLYAYGADLRSANPRAPAIPGELAGLIADRQVAIRDGAWLGAQVETVVRTPWPDGPCAYVLARGTTVPGWIGAILPASELWLLPTAMVIAAVLIAVGPVVSRIRRLTDEVRRSATVGFTSPVTVTGGDEIAELGRAFDAASRAVRTQLAEKDQREQALRRFLADTTHDVMIPLTVLQAHLATLQESAADGDAGPGRPTALVGAMDEAHYIASLLHNLGAAAKLDAGEPGLQRGRVDLGALVGRVVGRHRPIARPLQIELESAVPEAAVYADADVTLLEQAVSNVVYNAVRHNRPGGHVAVILEPASRTDFRIRVVDDGPGIAAAELSRLVERGYRGDAARSRAPDGQGLGLHIALRTAELHGMVLTLGPSEYGGLQVDLVGPIAS
jgi:two-component system sensor histidine kinase BaeS